MSFKVVKNNLKIEVEKIMDYKSRRKKLKRSRPCRINKRYSKFYYVIAGVIKHW